MTVFSVFYNTSCSIPITITDSNYRRYQKYRTYTYIYYLYIYTKSLLHKIVRTGIIIPISHNNFTDNVVSFQHKMHVHDSAVQPTVFLIVYILSRKGRSGCWNSWYNTTMCMYAQCASYDVSQIITDYIICSNNWC